MSSERRRFSGIGAAGCRVRHVVTLLVLSLCLSGLASPEVRIDPGEIVTLLPKDAIPAIRDPAPLLVPASEVKGEVMADGDKRSILTSAHLSRLFDTPVALVRANGFFQAMPGPV